MGISGVLIGEKKNEHSHAKVTFLSGTFHVEVANGGPNVYASFKAEQPAEQWKDMARTDRLRVALALELLANHARVPLDEVVPFKPEELAL